MKVDNRELVSARDLSRNYSQLIDAIEKGEVEKVVVTKNGKMEAVLIPVAHYEKLIDGAS